MAGALASGRRKIESTRSGGGLKLFCSGVGIRHPDITNASRRIKKSEQEKCAQNGVTDIVEVKIGYDGIALANSKKSPLFDVSRRIYFWLCEDSPRQGGGQAGGKSYKTWKEINPALPDFKIEVLGPPPTSGTRDAFVELAMEAGAKTFADLKKLRSSRDEAEIRALMEQLGIPASAFNKKGSKVFQKVAHAVREDGAYIEAGENDNLIVQKLKANPNASVSLVSAFLTRMAIRYRLSDRGCSSRI